LLFFTTLHITWTVNKAEELEEFKGDISTRAEAIMSLTKQDNGKIEVDFSDKLMPEYSKSAKPYYFQVWEWKNTTKKVIERSKSLKGNNLPLPENVTDKYTYIYTTLSNGRVVYILTAIFVPRHENEDLLDKDGVVLSEKKAVIAIAVGMEEYKKFKKMFLLLNATPLIVFFIALLAGIDFLVQKEMKPLSKLADKIHLLDMNKLDSNIDMDNPPLELKPLVDGLNNMLLRLKRTIKQEQQFSSDVSHELRTPITELRLMCEINLRDTTQKANHHIYREMLNIAEEMENIVEILLNISRMEANIDILQKDKCDLSNMFPKLIRQYQHKIEKHKLDIELIIPSNIFIVADYKKLELVLGNLINNSVTYALENSQCTITVYENKQAVDISISNLAPELKQEDINNLFKRFWQKDNARTNRGNSGLGLALVKSLCNHLDVSVFATLNEKKLLTITVSGFKAV